MAGEFKFKFVPFSENLRVLIVDKDPVYVKIITQMLKRYNYEVTQVAKATEALETLKQNPKNFDMMISDTCNDIDVLTFIVNIMKIENIPIVLVSGLEDTSTLINGVLQGADEVITKPVSPAEIETLWKHVYRRRFREAASDCSKSVVNSGDDSYSKNGDDSSSDWSESELSREKKEQRVRWHGSLQEKFTQAVIQLGGPEKAMPKKIVEMMNVPELSRESVASHLQKYRRQNNPLVLKNDTENNPLVVKNDTIGVVSTQSDYTTIPVSSHSCYRNNLPARTGHQQLPYQQHSPSILPPLPQMTAQPIPLAPTADPFATLAYDNDVFLDDEFLHDLFNGPQQQQGLWMQGIGAADGAAGPSAQQDYLPAQLTI